MNQKFWRNKKIFLTGHTGFKGSWLSLWLQMIGSEVSGYSLPSPTSPNLYSLANVRKNMKSIQGDIRDFEALHHAMYRSNPDIVIHMAAQPLVRESYLNPVATYDTNIMGTVNVLESVRQIGGVKAVLIVTSDKCYANCNKKSGYKENEPMGGYDPYSSSKACAELVTEGYRNSFFNPHDFNTHRVALATARAGNVIGGGDWAKDRLIPDIINAVLRGKPVIIRNPSSIRPWQHVLEPLSGYMQLIEKLWSDGLNYSEAWNFGPNESDAKPVSWIVELISKMWGEKMRWKIDSMRHPHEANYLKLNSSKSRRLLDWKPRWSLREAIENVVTWYRAYQSKENMRQITTDQIQMFMELDKNDSQN